MEHLVNLEQHPLQTDRFRQTCKQILDKNGVLVLTDFLAESVITSIQQEGRDNQHLAYYTADNHNIYLKPKDPRYPNKHPRNREVASTKGCITTNQIPENSALHTLYANPVFRDFLCAVLDEPALYEYADSLSSINLHYASNGQQLGWHFDNSSFAITLLIQAPEAGGTFEYVKDVRDADNDEMNFTKVKEVLEGQTTINTLSMNPGSLVLFRGRNAMHRVTPVEGNITRMLAVLAYNTEPNVSLSESARMTFYGRLK